VSQTQPEVEDVDSDNEDSDPVAEPLLEGKFGYVVDDVNSVLNPNKCDDQDELHSILGHCLILGHCFIACSKCRSRMRQAM